MDGSPTVTITFVIEYKGRFLLTLRDAQEKNFPSLWAFPGGKPNIGETVIDAITREVEEETGLELTDQAAFLDSYYFGDVVGVCFLVRAKSGEVKPSDEIKDFVWISDIDDLRKYRCIPGIYNHLARAKEVLLSGCLDSMEKMNLTPDKYMNRG